MNIKEKKCDVCRWRWEMSKVHCRKCKNDPDQAVSESNDPDHFEPIGE